MAGRYALIGRHFPELDVTTQIYLVKSTRMQHLPLLFEVGQRCKLDFLHEDTFTSTGLLISHHHQPMRCTKLGYGFEAY